MRPRALLAGLAAIGVGSAFAQVPPADEVPSSEEPAGVVAEGESGEVVGDEIVDVSASDPENGGRQPRDPFRPFTLDLRPVEGQDQPLTPLQRYELAQLRVAAVLLNLTPPRALLEDNSGMGFIVTPGTPIGRRRGVVAAIESRTVIVEEKALDFYGREQISRVAMEMEEESDNQGGIQE